MNDEFYDLVKNIYDKLILIDNPKYLILSEKNYQIFKGHDRSKTNFSDLKIAVLPLNNDDIVEVI